MREQRVRSGREVQAPGRSFLQGDGLCLGVQDKVRRIAAGHAAAGDGEAHGVAGEVIVIRTVIQLAHVTARAVQPLDDLVVIGDDLQLVVYLDAAKEP